MRFVVEIYQYDIFGNFGRTVNEWNIVTQLNEILPKLETVVPELHSNLADFQIRQQHPQAQTHRQNCADTAALPVLRQFPFPTHDGARLSGMAAGDDIRNKT